MPKYLVKLSKNKGRCTITIPKHLVKKRNLQEFDYLLIKATNQKPITIRGFNVKELK